MAGATLIEEERKLESISLRWFVWSETRSLGVWEGRGRLVQHIPLALEKWFTVNDYFFIFFFFFFFRRRRDKLRYNPLHRRLEHRAINGPRFPNLE